MDGHNGSAPTDSLTVSQRTHVIALSFDQHTLKLMGAESIYLWGRYEQEMAAAAAASSHQARVAHLELAFRYSLKVASADAEAARTEWRAIPPTSFLLKETTLD